MNYTDEQQKRINNVYNEREKALAENQQTYSGLLDDANSFRQQQNQMLAQQEKTQNEVLDKQLENQTNIINQQKEQAQKQTETQNKQALNSYNAFINPYGYQAESLASTGLNNSGLSETAKLGAYTTYQNRVAQANSSLQNAITNYDNSINEAILNNDVQKAQNALTRLQAELQANESYYNTKSSLTQNLLSNKLNINSQYDNQYNNVYNQVLNEQKEAEAIRQYNEKMAYQKQRDAIADAQWQKEYELSKKKVNSYSSGKKSNNQDYQLKADARVETNMSLNPGTLSSNDAWTWYKDNVMSNKFTESSLNSTLNNAMSKKKITQKDAEKIASIYYKIK